MKKYIFLTLFSILAFSFSAFAQDEERYSSSRLDNFANDLKRVTVDLADRTAQRIDNRSSASRSDIEEAFLAAQLDASAGLFQQMVRGNNRAAALRDAAAILNDFTRRAPGYGSNSFLWRDAQNAINNINRELGSGGGGGGGGGNFPDDRPIIGRAYWRGTVDDRVRLVLQDRNLRVETVSGRPYPEGIWSFTASLSRNVQVEVNKQKGRGNVRVLQQPSKDNDFTAVIEVYDDGGGAREYQLEIFWRAR